VVEGLKTTLVFAADAKGLLLLLLLLSVDITMSEAKKETEDGSQITTILDCDGRAPCNACVSNEGQCRWEEVKDDLLSMAQELEDTGSTSNQIRFNLYRHYNFLTHGSGNNRTALPTCCEKNIKKEYPSAVYKGFQKKE
jgi:hypothetical protein